MCWWVTGLQWLNTLKALHAPTIPHAPSSAGFSSFTQAGSAFTPFHDQLSAAATPSSSSARAAHHSLALGGPVAALRMQPAPSPPAQTPSRGIAQLESVMADLRRLQSMGSRLASPAGSQGGGGASPAAGGGGIVTATLPSPGGVAGGEGRGRSPSPLGSPVAAGAAEPSAVGFDEPAAAVGLDELMWQVAKLQAMFGAEGQGLAQQQAALPSEGVEGVPPPAALGRLGFSPPSRTPSGVQGDTRAQLMEVLARLSSSGSLPAPSPRRGAGGAGAALPLAAATAEAEASPLREEEEVVWQEFQVRATAFLSPGVMPKGGI